MTLKMTKSTPILALLALLGFAANSKAVVTIAHVENSTTGAFLTSAGTSLTTGEVSFGFFTNSLGVYAPTISAIKTIGDASPASAWSSILSLGWTDVRKLGTLGTGFDPAFPINIGATVQNVPFASLPSNTQLYVFGFNAGTWNNTAKTATFGLATEWAAVSIVGRSTSADNWLSPADGGTKVLNFAKLQASTAANDILVGSLGSRIGTSGYNVIMIPEPATASLVLLGIGLLVAKRRK